MSDDLFGENRDELFGGDEFGADDFGADDFGADFEDFGEDFEDIGLGDEDSDAPDFGDEFLVEEETDGRPTIFGLNRTFVLIGGVVAIVVCIGLVALLLAIQGQISQQNEVEQTVAAVYATNTQVANYLIMTETQNAAFANQTATAEAWTDTPVPTNTPTDTPIPPTLQPSPTSFITFVTPTPGDEAGGVSADAVAMTATALADILAGGLEDGQGGGGEAAAGGDAVALGATPTPIIVGQPAPTMPDTGIFDDIGQGGGVNSLATAGLAVLGLAAVIVVARRLRNQ